MTCHALTSLLLASAALVFSATVFADVDAAAAKNLARKSDCFKCHAVDKDKDGPSYHKVAEKYRGKAEAEAKLIHHVTAGERVKFPDGHEDEHKIVKSEDKDEIRNLVDWILSL